MVCVHVCVCAAQCHVLPLAICTCCSLPLNHTGRTRRATWRLPTQHGYLAELCLSSETHAHRHVFLPSYLDLMNNKCCSLNVLLMARLCCSWPTSQHFHFVHCGFLLEAGAMLGYTGDSGACCDGNVIHLSGWRTAHWTVNGLFGPSSIHRGESGNLHRSEVRQRSRWCIINGYFISTRN